MKKKRRLQLSCCCSVLRMEKKDKSDVCDLDKLCTRKFIIQRSTFTIVAGEST